MKPQHPRSQTKFTWNKFGRISSDMRRGVAWFRINAVDWKKRRQLWPILNSIKLGSFWRLERVLSLLWDKFNFLRLFNPARPTSKLRLFPDKSNDVKAWATSDPRNFATICISKRDWLVLLSPPGLPHSISPSLFRKMVFNSDTKLDSKYSRQLCHRESFRTQLNRTDGNTSRNFSASSSHKKLGTFSAFSIYLLINSPAQERSATKPSPTFFTYGDLFPPGLDGMGCPCAAIFSERLISAFSAGPRISVSSAVHFCQCQCFSS